MVFHSFGCFSITVWALYWALVRCKVTGKTHSVLLQLFYWMLWIFVCVGCASFATLRLIDIRNFWFRSQPPLWLNCTEFACWVIPLLIFEIMQSMSIGKGASYFPFQQHYYNSNNIIVSLSIASVWVVAITFRNFIMVYKCL